MEQQFRFFENRLAFLESKINTLDNDKSKPPWEGKLASSCPQF